MTLWNVVSCGGIMEWNGMECTKMGSSVDLALPGERGGVVDGDEVE